MHPISIIKLHEGKDGHSSVFFLMCTDLFSAIMNLVMRLDDKCLKLSKSRKEACQRLNLETVEDVLRYYPFRYDVMEHTSFENWKVKDKVTFEAKVVTAARVFRKGRLTTANFQVMYEEQILKVTIFNRPWVTNLNVEDIITITGIYQGNGRVTAVNYDTKRFEEHPAITPVYSLKEGLQQRTMRAIVQQVFEAVENEIQDDIPEEFIRRYRLLRKRDALYRIHFPSSSKDVDLAVRTLKYEEFLHFFTSVIYMRSKDVEEGSKPVRVFSVSKIRDKLKQLPFTFTKDQLQALNDILADLSSPKPMYRLVQGDVGCGKTAVAVFALYAAVLAGYQAALLAPTEILARQHLLSLKEMLGSEVRAGLLYSGLSKEEKKNMLEGMADGSIQIVVGTHALLQENVMFQHLGLVVTDEQQRFGVEQRRALVRKGDGCDFLLMSATPIPRTLASALFGEMNISTIHTMPKGRTAPITKRINENSFRSVLDEVKQLLSDGRQLYIICAAVEEGESDVRNVETVTENIRKLFPQYTVASLTGPMKSEEKEAVMNMFACNQAQILVSTTVVEVGMNVVNATGMIIYNAERFGLSQLHQLRGRIQRGSTQGQCWLLSSAREEKTLQRLDTLVSTNDGFVIAQEDLRQRGPGDILGTRQSGIPDFILGSFNDDTNIMDTARKDAAYICEHPDNPDYAVILDRIASRYQEEYVD